MGMIANYQYLDDKNLIELKNIDSDDVFDSVESWNEDEDILLDIDKMWDVMHFVLTGVDSSSPLDDNPLSEAVVGCNTIGDISEFVAYIEKDRIPQILSALEGFDIENAMENFSMKECKEADLYPNIWDDEDEIDDIKEEIIDYFEMMKAFYKNIMQNDGNVLVTIY